MNILDLDPVEFAGALEELALDPEESARLRSMYKKKNSSLAPVYSAIDSQQDKSAERNTGNIVPLSAPAGKSLGLLCWMEIGNLQYLKGLLKVLSLLSKP